MNSNAGVARKPILDILNIDTPSVKISKTENQQSNQTKRSHKKIKRSPLRKRTQSHDLIKKGFNVCYALDEFIRTSQMYHNEIQNQSMTK